MQAAAGGAAGDGGAGKPGCVQQRAAAAWGGRFLCWEQRFLGLLSLAARLEQAAQY